MNQISSVTLKDWQSQQQGDSDFITIAGTLEIGYQIARLRIRMCLATKRKTEVSRLSKKQAKKRTDENGH